MKHHGLTQKSVESYLLALDKIGAIELHPGNVVKSEFAENCRLSFGLPLIKQVVDQKHRPLRSFAHIPNERFRGRKYVVNGTLNMKPETASQLIKDVKNLVDGYMKRSEREGVVEPENALEDIGFLFLVTPTEGMSHEAVSNL